MSINLANQIESALAWRAEVNKKTRSNPRRVRRVSIDELFQNQTDAMKQHLVHDNNHRMLDRYKTAPRSNRPGWVQEAFERLVAGISHA